MTNENMFIKGNPLWFGHVRDVAHPPLGFHLPGGARNPPAAAPPPARQPLQPPCSPPLLDSVTPGISGRWSRTAGGPGHSALCPRQHDPHQPQGQNNPDAITEEQSVLCPPGDLLFSCEANGSGGREFLRATKHAVWHDPLLVEQMTLCR